MKLTLETFLEESCANMIHCFNLTHFNVFLEEVRKLDCTMQIEVDYKYLDAKIAWGSKVREMWRLKQSRFIEMALAHELTHIITGEVTAPFQSKAHPELEEHFDERVTESVSRLLYNLYALEKLAEGKRRRRKR